MSYLDDRIVNHWTLLQVFERGEIALECQKCWRIAKVATQTLVNRCGSPDATVGQVEAKSRCGNCGSRNTKALIHLRGMRGDRAWRPCPPRAAR